jgi:adenylosuccinate synthase
LLELNNTTIVGLQWGDEGKGKILDVLASDFDYAIRFQGGANAGHTVIVGDEKYVFHLIPSGILYPHVTCVIGNGAVIDILTLCDELEMLRKRGIDVQERLKISNHAHVVMPYHRMLDEARELASKKKIGTTKRGIGPCYADKVSRVGIRIEDLFRAEKFHSLLEKNLTEKNAVLEKYGRSPLDLKKVKEEYLEAAAKIEGFVADTQAILQQAYKAGKKLLFEGAQGIMLDIDHGTYPYVTSSNTGSANAANGCGLPAQATGRILGIVKAYTTRVGEGPFPTELTDEIGEFLQREGSEFGSTTGRPRRCGWLDLVQLKYAVKLSGAKDIVLTKLDVLSGLDEIKAATHYDSDWSNTGKQYYAGFKGFSDISRVTDWSALPREAKEYIHYIEDFLDVRVLYVSVGPQRSSLIKNPNW